MELFKKHLQQEYLRRVHKNPAYSLRSFASQLGINHATLSTLLSGKRPLTKTTALKIAGALNMGPAEIESLLPDVKKDAAVSTPYHLLQSDAFSAMSEWYFDAVLEMTLIKNIKLSPALISESLGISKLQARLTLETLERLELLAKDRNGHYKMVHKNSTNILDPDFTTAAQKKYQKSVLEKSFEALEKVERKKRDHTSTTMAINTKDLPKVKELIQDFRHRLNNYLQRDSVTPNEVYQLQVSFFPLTETKK